MQNVRKKLSSVQQKLLGPAQRRKQARIDRQKELDITFGEQDTIDILSYAGLEENVDYLHIETPDFLSETVEGAPTIKAAVVPVILEYSTSNPLN